jgi:hypothetical protein
MLPRREAAVTVGGGRSSCRITSASSGACGVHLVLTLPAGRGGEGEGQVEGWCGVASLPPVGHGDEGWRLCSLARLASSSSLVLGRPADAESGCWPCSRPRPGDEKVAGIDRLLGWLSGRWWWSADGGPGSGLHSFPTPSTIGNGYFRQSVVDGIVEDERSMLSSSLQATALSGQQLKRLSLHIEAARSSNSAARVSAISAAARQQLQGSLSLV